MAGVGQQHPALSTFHMHIAKPMPIEYYLIFNKNMYQYRASSVAPPPRLSRRILFLILSGVFVYGTVFRVSLSVETTSHTFELCCMPCVLRDAVRAAVLRDMLRVSVCTARHICPASVRNEKEYVYQYASSEPDQKNSKDR